MRASIAGGMMVALASLLASTPSVGGAAVSNVPDTDAQLVFSGAAAAAAHNQGDDSFQNPQRYGAEMFATKRVPVTLGVMSRCPDALYCESVWTSVLAATARNIPPASGGNAQTVNSHIDLTLSFIGEPVSSNSSAALEADDDATSEAGKYGVVCKHGDQECLGNIQELCVMHRLKSSKVGSKYDLSPSAAQSKWYEYVECLNYEGLREIGKPGLAKKCLELVGGPQWEKDGVKQCIEGKEGRQLLLDSVKASKKAGIRNSCTILVNDKPVCIRDGGEWKNCTSGHEVIDFVHAIEKGWNELNPNSTGCFAPANNVASGIPLVRQTLSPSRSHQIAKRQLGPTSSNGPTSTDGGQTSYSPGQTPPNPASIFKPSVVPTPALAFQRRQAQQSGTSTSSTDDGQPTSLFAGLVGTNLPIPFIGFSLAAIALFIVVVAFVLLRIFLRNRRLRRLGIFVEDDFFPGRFMGASSRIIEDTLPPPKLWEAKIADVRKAPPSYHSATGGLGEDLKEKDRVHTWDSLMPVAAALPPNLYPVLFDSDGKEITPTPNGAPPPAEEDDTSAAHRFTRRLPRLGKLRRSQNQDSVADQTEGAGPVSPDEPDAAPIVSEPTAASVNITVLIAMPSSKTVFPSQKRVTNPNAASSLRSPLRSAAPNANIPQVDEADEDADGSLEKGKMRRTPSLRSIRTVGSVKSVAEARRQAFFGQDAADKAEEMTKEADVETEEEELPELVFGTASVPVFKRIAGQGSFFAPSGELVHPTKADLLQLLADAKTARERKAQADAVIKATKPPSQEPPEAVNSVVTSPSGADVVDAESQDQDHRAASIASSSHPVLGDVVSRMMQHNHQSAGELERPSTQHARSSFGPSFDLNREAQLNNSDPLQQPSMTTFHSQADTETPLTQQDRESNDRNPPYVLSA